MARLASAIVFLVAASSLFFCLVEGAASEIVNDVPDLFPFESAQLTKGIIDDLALKKFPNISLFAFRDGPVPVTGTQETKATPKDKKCKTYPGDADWPTSETWQGFDTLLGGALIKTVPEPAVCYDGPEWNVYDVARCQNLSTNWWDSFARDTDPTSIRAILYQGMTCMPPDSTAEFFGNKPGCTLGGFPEYVVQAATVAQIQLAINFARNANLRLIIKNTGHDFGAKSVGMGSLSIWTHNLKESKYYENYKAKDYSGPAVKFGAGTQVYEANEFAKAHGITVVGGEGKTVGLVGGFAQGGGHSPLTSLWGMAADQILSLNIVTADGRFIQADAETNPDIFWAVRGGGGSTYGVVTSMTFKAYPKIKVTTMTYNMTTGGNFTRDKFWAAQKAYVDRFEQYADLGYYCYYRIRHVENETTSNPLAFIAPNTTEKELRESVAPMLAEWDKIGVPVEPVIKEFDNYHDAWMDAFPLERWSTTMRQTSRLIPRETIVDNDKRTALVQTLREIHEDGAHMVLFNMRNPPGYDKIDNAVNPAFRDMLMFVIPFVLWNTTDSTESVTRLSRKLTFDWNPRLIKLTPGSGTYMSESDYIEPNRPQSFHGSKYARLYDLKQTWDPDSVFYAQNAVGSEDWAMSEDLLGHLPSQNSKLCRN